MPKKFQSRCHTGLIVNKGQIDGTTFNWVFTSLALYEKNIEIEISNIIYATLVIKISALMKGSTLECFQERNIPIKGKILDCK